jgi:hypothetical protein
LFDQDCAKDVEHDIQTPSYIKVKGADHGLDLLYRLLDSVCGGSLVAAGREQLRHQLSKTFGLFPHQIEVGLSIEKICLFPNAHTAERVSDHIELLQQCRINFVAK